MAELLRTPLAILPILLTIRAVLRVHMVPNGASRHPAVNPTTIRTPVLLRQPHRAGWNSRKRPSGTQAISAEAEAERLAAATQAAAPPSNGDGSPALAWPADEQPGELGTAHLQRFMSQHGIQGQIVPPLGGGAPPAGCCEAKSLVFLADEQPLVSRTTAVHHAQSLLRPAICLRRHRVSVGWWAFRMCI
jgi:hypothetical protein